MSKTYRPFKPNRNKVDLKLFEDTALLFGIPEERLQKKGQYYVDKQIHDLSWKFLSLLAQQKQQHVLNQSFVLTQQLNGKSPRVIGPFFPIFDNKHPIQEASKLIRKNGRSVVIYTKTVKVDALKHLN